MDLSNDILINFNNAQSPYTWTITGTGAGTYTDIYFTGMYEVDGNTNIGLFFSQTLQDLYPGNTIVITRNIDNFGTPLISTIEGTLKYQTSPYELENIRILNPAMDGYFTLDASPTEYNYATINTNTGNTAGYIYSISLNAGVFTVNINPDTDVTYTLFRYAITSNLIGNYSPSAITFTDNNTTGELVDTTSLLYKQGNSISPQVIAQKDNTLFLGNYSLNKPLFETYQRRSDIFSISYASKFLYNENATGVSYNKTSSLPKGNYTTFNNTSAKTFKWNEWYRFGLQFILNTGEVSEPLFIEDIKNEIKPDTQFTFLSGIDVYGANASMTLSDTTIEELVDLGVVAVKPVVVYPELKDRSIVAQGIICPTTYNMKERTGGTIWGQSSWFFRPKGDTQIEYKHDYSLKEKIELVCNQYQFDSPRLDIGGGNTVEPLQSINGYYFIDESLVTLNSPELDFIDLEDITGIENLKFRIIGVTSITGGRNSSLSTFKTAFPAGVVEPSGEGEFIYPNYSIAQTREYGDLIVGNALIGGGVYPLIPWTGYRANIANTEDYSHIANKNAITFNFAGINQYLDTLDYWTPPNGEAISFFNAIGDDIIGIKGIKNETSVDMYSGNYSASLGGTFLYTPLTDVWDWTPADIVTTDLITMRYKSNNHAVVGFKWDDYAIPLLPFYEVDGEGAEHFLDNEDLVGNDPHWGAPVTYTRSGLVFPSLDETPPFTYDDSPKLYIGELYREDSSIINRFGGDSDEALINNRWVQCGEIVSLVDLNTPKTSVDIIYDGDCNLQRYDCLKTYAYAEVDYQNNVEILSFICETRINLDACQDKYRGTITNKGRNPENINVLNQVYQQKNTFFSYTIPNYRFFNLDNFNNSFTSSKTKLLGEVVDTWTNITLASTLDANGSLGALRSIKLFNNYLFGFQDKAIFQILFNSNVQVSSTTGLPIEIANSGKVDGIRYISTNVGTTNKWGIVDTPNGLYFVDNTSRGIYSFNGELKDISQKYGFYQWIGSQVFTEDSWTPNEFGHFRSFYDITNDDVYFVNKDWCLVYSEVLGQFTSFYNYEETPFMFNLDGSFYSLKKEWGETDNIFSLWEQNTGEYNSYFGHIEPYYITYLLNPDMPYDKVFNNIEYRADQFDDNGDLVIGNSFDTIDVWNEYQSGSENLLDVLGTPSNLKQKFRIWRANIPRVTSLYTDTRITNPYSRVGADRLRNPWCYLKLTGGTDDNNRMVLHDLMIKYTV